MSENPIYQPADVGDIPRPYRLIPEEDAGDRAYVYDFMNRGVYGDCRPQDPDNEGDWKGHNRHVRNWRTVVSVTALFVIIGIGCLPVLYYESSAIVKVKFYSQNNPTPLAPEEPIWINATTQLDANNGTFTYFAGATIFLNRTQTNYFNGNITNAWAYAMNIGTMGEIDPVSIGLIDQAGWEGIGALQYFQYISINDYVGSNAFNRIYTTRLPANQYSVIILVIVQAHVKANLNPSKENYLVPCVYGLDALVRNETLPVIGHETATFTINRAIAYNSTLNYNLGDFSAFPGILSVALDRQAVPLNLADIINPKI